MATMVIFRKWRKNRGGGVIALFPEIPATNDGEFCGCYEHLGQHDSTSPDLVYITTLATPEEYADLLAELERIGYDDLIIRKRFPPNHIDTRLDNLAHIDPIAK